ncbi:MAG TPA: DUF3300 domain-containing protein [Stellaceae bacterium]|nr:DUF3300 domain-containing protein [Stellaceae bacterium]
MRRDPILASLMALALLAGTAEAQPAYPPPPGAVVMAYAPQQLDQMLAPIALYPDPLLSSILTAATYPIEVDAAAHWLATPGAAALTDGALAAALAATGWDPSVQSLVPFPPVLAMLDQQLAWTQALGNAFLAQPQDIMASIQRLRRVALTAGALVSSPYETVTDYGAFIAVTPTQPQMVYVPVYNPAAVYGVWPYPGDVPDYFGPPPGLAQQYLVGAIGFGIGFAIVDALWNWCDFDWRDRTIQVDPARFNRMDAGHPPTTATTWQHDPQHRRGAPYVDAASRARFDRPLAGSADERRQFRFAAPPVAAVPAAPAAPAVQVFRGAPNVPAAPPARMPTAFDAAARGPQAQVEIQRGLQSRQAAVAPVVARPAAPVVARPAAPRPAAAPQRPAPPQSQPQPQPGGRRP